MRLLVCHLQGDMAAWGLDSRGGYLRAQPYPGRGALHGLLGACLGIDRADTQGLRALAARYDYVVRVDKPGTYLLDYHTLRVTKGAIKDKVWDHDACGHHYNTQLTYREYYTDVAYRVGVYARQPDSDQDELDRLVDAMHSPAYVPYLGRKTCLCTAPLCPSIQQDDTVMAAFATYDAALQLTLPYYDPHAQCPVYWGDLPAHVTVGIPPERMYWARDTPLYTAVRGYLPRRIYVGTTSTHEGRV